MELKLLNDQGQSSSNVAAPDTIFGRDYNEALIHQVVVAYQATHAVVIANKKIVKKFITPPKNLGVKKVRAVLVLVCRHRLCGAAAVGFSRTRPMKTSRTKLTKRCIAQVSARSSRSWLVKVAYL